MDQDFIGMRKLLFINSLKEGNYIFAMQILKELIEADLEINFKVETEEEIRKRENNLGLGNIPIADKFRLLLGENAFDNESD